jgi:hypothetical protein
MHEHKIKGARGTGAELGVPQISQEIDQRAAADQTVS